MWDERFIQCVEMEKATHGVSFMVSEPVKDDDDNDDACV